MLRMYLYTIMTALLFSCAKEYSCEKCMNEPNEGNVIFYTPGTCVNGKPLALIIDGNLHSTVSSVSFVPDCSTPGITAVALSPGIHHWEAFCNDRTIAGGMIDILPGTCQVEEIK